MATHIIWASEAEASHVLAPSAEKIAQGWDVEVPPHEYFNWWMNRVDERLAVLESPVENHTRRWFAKDRTATVLANERFDLPAAYIVGGNHLKVFIDGLLCEVGEDAQYVECGTPGTESTYIRFNDDIEVEYDIRVEIPIRAVEPIRYADEELVASVEDLRSRVTNLEAPTYCMMFDSPANTRAAAISANTIYVLPQEYTVGANQLQVYLDGILQYIGLGYVEVGGVGNKSTDIKFLSNIPVSTNIRVYISQKNGEAYTVLNEATTLAALDTYVHRHRYHEIRQDTAVNERIEAMAEFTVPEYEVEASGMKVYKNGRLLIPNRDYSENSEPGEETSTKIIWNGSVDAGSLITVTVPVY